METIYDFIISQESGYTKPIQIEDGWDWSMKEHLRRSFLYKNSQFEEQNDDRTLRPNKNIVKPILNVQYRTEGFDVKDIELFVDNKDLYYKSFLLRKFHEKWAVENEMDTFIDEMVESYVDYGGTLVRKTANARPDVVDLRSLAFADQSDILDNPFGILHEMSVSQLREWEGIWGEDKNGATITVEELITLTKDEDEDKIKIYEVHGTLPKGWIDDNKEEKDVPQIQVVAFYKKENDDKVGVTLFRAEEPELPFRFLKRDDVTGRALGFGGVEELFDSQQWTNFAEIKVAEMLDSASKTLFKSNDANFKSRNNLTNVESNEVLVLREGTDLSQIDTFPRNLTTFNESLDRWEIYSQKIGAVSEGQLGESPSAGTPFKLFEAQNIEARDMHRYRQGKISVFTDMLYRDWILPYIVKEVVKGKEFLATLSADEVIETAQQIVDNKVNRQVVESVLNGEIPAPEEILALREAERENFLKGGNKKFMKILKDEFKGQPIGVSTNIAGKQKNLALLTDKIVNVLRQFISTPEIRQDPEMIKLLNVILESSGMSPMMFGAAPQMQQLQQPQQGGGGTEPLQALGQTAKQNESTANR